MKPYVAFKNETQLKLLSLLSLYKDREPTITLAYTKSEPEYPEKILNLKWSLSE